MEMHGEYLISANREVVWNALNDPAVLKRCLKGCESLEKISDSEFEAKITTKVGPIKTAFDCSISLSDIDPPNAYTLSGQGDGGASGYAKGSVRVFLTENGDATTLRYTVEASLRGKIGQMGSRVVDNVARRMADEFFENLKNVVNEYSGIVAETGSSGEQPTERHGSSRLRIWAIAIMLILVILGISYFSANY